MLVTKKTYVFPVQHRRHLLTNEDVINGALEKAQIYSKALSDSLINIITITNKSDPPEKVSDLLHICIQFANKVHHFAFIAQHLISKAFHIIKLFKGITATLESLAKGHVDVTTIVSCLYGLFELINEANETSLAA